MFKPVPSKVDFPELEQNLLRYWEEKNIFQRSIDQRQDRPNWVFYDGPPGTNGKPHVGHMMQSALKDLFGRYKTMKGYRVLRKAGWDTHGLPVELTAERELKLKSKREIESYGVEKYIEYCRNTVFRYKKEWEEAIYRCGRFIDLKNAYATLTTDYIQSDWWTIKNIHNPSPEIRRLLELEEGESLLYKSDRISPYCPRCGTALSNFETAQGYKDTTDFALFPKFQDAEDPHLYYLAWTTTAWTLLSNVALAVGPEIDYVFLKLHNGEKLALAESRLESVRPLIGPCELITRAKGKELSGRRYLPLWDFLERPGTPAHTIIADNYVTALDGTGIVHLAAYGEDDFRIIRQKNLPLIQNVDENGECQAGMFSGRDFRDEDLCGDITQDLTQRHLLLHREKYEHSYPFCFRCDSALMYFPRASWFINTSRIKDKLLKANKEIKWYPDFIQEGRFGNWLENNVDWNITRERYWGSPLPIWTCEKCAQHQVVGSISELDQHYFRSHNDHLADNFDPHKPQIDRITLTCPFCKGTMKRENLVLDSWFNAGIMPWAQFGYPSTPGSVEIFRDQWPGDFICEAIDQTRGWFYTMLATAVMAMGQTSFKNVMCTELILDAKGFKMSKSRGNVIHPMDMFNKYGADPFRWVFYQSNPWTVKNFSQELLVETLRNVCIPLWNAFSFFVTYANIDGWEPSEDYVLSSNNCLDQWILSEFQTLNDTVQRALDDYDVATASAAIEKFIGLLTNWYIRRSRRRFWKSENDLDKDFAYHTLYYILLEFSKIISPFTPFISDRIYMNLTRDGKQDSVHLEDYPPIRPELHLPELEKKMNLVLETVALGRSLRNDSKLKIRQPLNQLILITPNWQEIENLTSIIAEELNLKHITLQKGDSGLVRKALKPNFSFLGPKFGSRTQEAVSLIAKFEPEQVEDFLSRGKIEVMGLALTAEDLVLEEKVAEGWAFKRGEMVSALLDTRLNDELINEGYAREFINKVQNLRKDREYNITDRINIKYSCDDRLESALSSHRDLIAREVLASSLKRITNGEGDILKINDKSAIVKIN